MVTFGLSFYYKHITTVITTISQTGNFPPECYIFTFGCCLSSFFLFLLIFTIDLIFEKKIKEQKELRNEFNYILKDFTFYIGIASCLSYAGLAIVSWEANSPIHGGFTVIMFISNSLHCLASTLLQIKLKMKNQIKLKIFISIISFILMIILFYFHYKEADFSNFKFYFKFRSVLETTTIYSLFSYSLCYYQDFQNLNFNLIEIKDEKNE